MTYSRCQDWATPVMAARIVAVLVSLVAGFQLALALGVPWGHLAMGGAFPGSYPREMRVVALLNVVILAAVGLVVWVRARLAFPAWLPAVRRLVWGVVGLLGLALILNLITPSPMERFVWAPVILVLLVASMRVALGG